MFVMQSAFWRTAWTHHDELVFGKDVSCRADVMIYLPVLSALAFHSWDSHSSGSEVSEGNLKFRSLETRVIMPLLVWVGAFLRVTSFPVLKCVFFCYKHLTNCLLLTSVWLLWFLLLSGSSLLHRLPLVLESGGHFPVAVWGALVEVASLVDHRLSGSRALTR